MRDYRQIFDANGEISLNALRANEIAYPCTISHPQTFREAIVDKRATTTHMFDDGVVIINYMFDRVFASSPSKVEIEQIPWSSVTGLDLRDGRIRLIGPQVETNAGHVMSQKQLGTTWKDYLAKQQLKGVIPARVAVFPPEVEDKRKSDKGSTWAFPLVLVAIVAGVPFFKGGGSLAAAALPGLADITPAAVDLAIHNNPQWPVGTQLRLIGVAAAIHATPTAALTTLFGFQQNTASSLWFIPIYWAETLGSRDWQIKFLAEAIANNENRPSAPK